VLCCGVPCRAVLCCAVVCCAVSCRGLLAAGSWDAAGVWQVSVWDTYSGHLDRQLQGAAAHMLMATLSQELTSSLRHLSRTQSHTPAAAATTGPSSTGYGQYHSSSSGSGSKRGSLDISATGAAAASGDGGSRVGTEAGGFTPRLQLVNHTTGPFKPLLHGRPDLLLLDIDVQQLIAQLDGYTKQQKRDSSRQQRQQQQQAAGGLTSRGSLDSESYHSSTPSARASRSSSLDLMGLLHGSSPGAEVVSPAGHSPPAPLHQQQQQQQQQQQRTPRTSGTVAADNSTDLQCRAAQLAGRYSQQQQQQQHPLHARAVLPPAVAAAVQGLCLLHRWGLKPLLDQQLVLLLQQQQGSASAAGQALLGTASRSSSLNQPLSPVTPAASTSPAAAVAPEMLPLRYSGADPAWNGTCPADTSGAAAAAAAAAVNCAEVWPQDELLVLLQQLLQGPAPGSPILQPSAPCLSQEALLSPGCGAAVVCLPSARTHSSTSGSRHAVQQQQERGPQGREGCTVRGGLQAQLSAMGQQHAGGRAHHSAAASMQGGHQERGSAAAAGGHDLLLLRACPTLLSARWVGGWVGWWQAGVGMGGELRVLEEGYVVRPVWLCLGQFVLPVNGVAVGITSHIQGLLAASKLVSQLVSLVMALLSNSLPRLYCQTCFSYSRAQQPAVMRSWFISKQAPVIPA